MQRKNLKIENLKHMLILIILSFCYSILISVPNDNCLFIDIDSKETYIAGLLRNEKEEQFISIWQLPQYNLIYTTKDKILFVTDLTWVGQKLVYIGIEGIRYLHQLDLPKNLYTIKIFIFDPITNREETFNIKVNKNIDPNIIESCDDDTLILFELGEKIGVYTVIMYSLSKAKQINKVIIDLKGYNFENYYSSGARLLYCSPDHRKLWVVTYREGPRLPYTGYLPAPVPILSLYEDGKEKTLMDPRKEWLVNCNLVRVLDDNIISAIITDQFDNIYLVHFSSQGEIYRRRLNIEAITGQGHKFDSLEFLWIDSNYIYCYNYDTKEIFKCNIMNNQIVTLFKNIQNLKLFPIKASKLWILLNNQNFKKIQ